MQHYHAATPKPGIKTILRTYSVAASVVLAFLGLGALAYVVIQHLATPQVEIPSPNHAAEKPLTADLPPAKDRALDMEPQWYLLDNTKGQQISTLYGNEIDIRAHSFKTGKSQKVLLHVAEVLDSTQLTQYFKGGTMAIFIAAFDVDGQKASEIRKPLSIRSILPTRSKVQGEIWYNKDHTHTDAWQKQASYQVQYIQINQTMTRYEDYMEARALLDTLHSSYTLKDGLYSSTLPGHMRYTQACLQQLKQYIRNYEKDPQYTTNLHTAKTLWKRYQDQHTLEIQTGTVGACAFEIHKAGWHVVR